MSDTVERQDPFGQTVEVPVGQDGVNPVSPQNPPGAAYDPEELGAVTAETHTLGVDYASNEVQKALAGEPVGEVVEEPEEEPELPPDPAATEAIIESVTPAAEETAEPEADHVVEEAPTE